METETKTLEKFSREKLETGAKAEKLIQEINDQIPGHYRTLANIQSIINQNRPALIDYDEYALDRALKGIDRLLDSINSIQDFISMEK